MVAVNKVEDTREKVRRLLRELFQFDVQDLDFGIYRILNFRRKEIEWFIEKDLIEAVEAEFKEYAKAGVAELQREVEQLKAEINRNFGEGTIDEHGSVMKHAAAPKIKEYLRKVEELSKFDDGTWIKITGSECSQYGSFWLTENGEPYLLTGDPISSENLQIV